MKIYILTILSFFALITNAENNIKNDSETQFIETLTKHLNAVTNRDSKSLESTLSPKGNMQLILPQTEIMYSVDTFMDYHKQWFAAKDWTFETKILNTNIKADLGMATVDIIYREPIRDGKPYFNRMTVSYVLEKMQGQWYVIKDHASSIEKSTDESEN